MERKHLQIIVETSSHLFPHVHRPWVAIQIRARRRKPKVNLAISKGAARRMELEI